MPESSDMRVYFRETITDVIKKLKDSEAQMTESLKSIDSLDPGNAVYLVDLHSMWSNEGEKSVKVEHTGSLADAVLKAEAAFKRTNNRSDVQAVYNVFVKLGDQNLIVPGEYYSHVSEYAKKCVDCVKRMYEQSLSNMKDAEGLEKGVSVYSG